LEIQKPIVTKYGFEASAEGVQEAMMAFTPDDIYNDPLVYKKHNTMELLLDGAFDWYNSSFLIENLKTLGEYRAIPENRFPIIPVTRNIQESEGRVGLAPRTGLLGAEETEQLVAACKRGDATRARQLLGTRKLGASSKDILVNIGYRMLGSKGATTLANALSKDLESLELDISGNNIGLEGAKAIAARMPKNLRILKLNLSNNVLTLEGVKAITGAIPQGLKVLSLGFAGMKMGLEGAKAIADHMPPQAEEVALDLYSNNIGDDGVVCISRALPKTISSLNVVLLENQISRRGFNVMDRQIGDPFNKYHLPKLDQDSFQKVAELEVLEYKEDEDGVLQRQLDWRTYF